MNLDKNLDNPPLAKSAPVISGNSELCLDGDVDKPPLVKCALVETEITGSGLDRDLDKPSLANSVNAVTSVTVDADSAQSIGELVSDLHSLDKKSHHLDWYNLCAQLLNQVSVNCLATVEQTRVFFCPLL